MLENKTANNIVDRYHRIITGDQSQIEMGIIPEGKITITENGTDIDVAQYAKADVEVPSSGGTLDGSIDLYLTSGYEAYVENFPIIEDGSIKTKRVEFPYSPIRPHLTVPLPITTKQAPYFLKVVSKNSGYAINGVHYYDTQGDAIENYNNGAVVGVYNGMPALDFTFRQT